MATHPASEAPHSAPVELQNRHRRALTRLYEERPEANLFQLCWLESHGVEAHARGQFTFWGLFDDDRQLQASALDLAGRLVMVEARHPATCADFGAFFLRRGTRFQHVVSRRPCSEAF